MITTGLVSVTFRNLAPHQIVDLVRLAELDGIEWGGDVHVPHGDLAAAHAVRRMTHEAGLRVIAYGSYFRCLEGEPFAPVIETALALGAPMIRVWAGKLGSAEADSGYRAHVVAQAITCAAAAAQHGITVAYEFHGNTLTDTATSAIALLQDTPPMCTLWQPPHDVTEEERLAGLRGVLPWLSNLHVFHWRMPDRARLPLRDGEAVWRERLHVARTCGRNVAALLEFVRDDSPEQFMEDAAVLKSMIS
jgi:sugar phosphate isomerase/epimerase